MNKIKKMIKNISSNKNIMPVIKATTLELSKITFSDVKTDNHGRKMVFVNYNGGKITVQTPKMYVPNGIKRWRKKDAVDNKDDSFEMEMSFGGEDKSDDIRVFHEKMEEFDELVKQQIMSHSKEWLGKPKISMELIENAFYAPTVRVPMDKEGNVLDYPSRVRAKLDRERVNGGDDFSGRFLSYKKPATPVLMFDESKTLIEMDESNFESVVPKNSQVVAVLELVYLTITTKVSAKWKLVQAKVSKNQQNITGYAMLDDEEEVQEQEDLDSETPASVPVTSSAPVATADDDDDDDEDDEEDVLEEDELDAPEPEPVVKAKPRGRKVAAA
jgi:hypothetical protein